MTFDINDTALALFLSSKLDYTCCLLVMSLNSPQMLNLHLAMKINRHS